MRRSIPEALDSPPAASADAMVRVDVLRNFASLVTQLGGDPRELLAQASIDAAVLARPHAVIPHASLARLLKRAALDLACADFGMRLAAAQDVAKVLGPLEVAMRNSATLRAAFEYCSANMQACSVATRFVVEDDPEGELALLHLDIQLPESVFHPQAVEHALLLTQQHIAELSGRRIRAREIWLAHEPIASIATYEKYFGASMKFSQAKNGLLLPSCDLASEIPGADPQLYGLATYFIDAHYPAHEVDLSARVSALIERLLQDKQCTREEVAAQLGMTPRALQRGLRAAGASFESIRDAVRRQLALTYLTQSKLPLIRVAEKLGYADAGVLTKSCYRWFSASPRQLRTGPASTDSHEMN